MPANRSASRWLLPLLAPVILMALWELAASRSWLDRLFFPPPSALAATFVHMLQSGDLAANIRATLARAGISFLFGAVAGISCGVIMGVSMSARRILEPWIAALYSAPKLTLLPMLMLLTGTGELPGMILIATAVFLMVAIHTLDGVRRVSPHFVEMAANHGATPALLFRRVYLPSSAPQIFTGLRLGVGRAVGVAITVELVSGGPGIGSLVWRSWQTFSTERLYVAVIVAALLGATLQQVLKLLERTLIPWKAR